LTRWLHLMLDSLAGRSGSGHNERMDRAPEPEADDEVGAVLGWLNFHRDALASKCEGMTAEQMVTASAPPSTLTLLGLVRHLTDIERDYLVNDLSANTAV
jgi:hypothetical protein